VSCAGALRRLLEAGVPSERISFSSDGQGSLPDFDAAGTLKGLTVGSVESLFQAVREAVLTEGVPLAEALSVITSTPATVYKLPGKGRIRRGFDADLVLLDPRTLRISSVIARGRILLRNGTLLAKGTFEA
jgi:beta-aspartyl-dipeptidase (metallo-type)